MKRVTRWEPENFELEKTTLWSFPNHGNWATHDSKWRGNWSPYVPRNVILRYTRPGDWVLDQFAGGGTTLVEAKLLGRNAWGVDINTEALECCRQKIDFHRQGCGKVFLRQGDARNLSFLDDSSIDLVCTHPPYANIIQYSEDIEGDLSHLDKDQFLEQMPLVAREALRVLKPGGTFAMLIGDMRRQGCVQPLAMDTLDSCLSVGFKLKEIIIKAQHNCRATGFWKERSLKYNFFLLAHEYLFILKK